MIFHHFAYFAYTICLGELADHANPWQIALTAVLVEGVIFIILGRICGGNACVLQADEGDEQADARCDAMLQILRP